jgi:hypothetical protein
MGKFRTRSRQGYGYVLTIIDDYSRFCWVFPMKTKGEASSIFKEWVGKAERETSKKVWRIRSNNGKEFKNDAMTEFCKLMHYHQELTNPYTLEQNGLSERQNWTLLTTMRSLLAACNLGAVWWIDALLTTCFMRIRTAHSALTNFQPPYQKYTNRKPQIQKMYIFGCKVSVLNSAHALKSKLSQRGKLGYFIGYPVNTTGYRILLDTGNVLESSNVLFFERTILDLTANFLTDSKSVKKKGMPEIIPYRVKEEVSQQLKETEQIAQLIQSDPIIDKNSQSEEDSDDEIVGGVQDSNNEETHIHMNKSGKLVIVRKIKMPP